jgi:hypothetical protein
MEHSEEEIKKHIEKIDRAISDKDIISGIHNYCDRWCERCAFTKHCAVFKMDPRNLEDASDEGEQKLFEELSLNFAAMAEMLRQMMEEKGIDEAALSEYKKPEHIESEAEKLTKEYSSKITDWIAKNKELFRELMVREGMENEAMVLAIDDAVEVLSWYSFFIYVKTRRAMDVDDEPLWEGITFEEQYHDNLGTAKLTLISIRRSMDALSFLLKYMPEQESEILDMLVLLEKASRLINKRWPTAMNFKRPGLDE